MRNTTFDAEGHIDRVPRRAGVDGALDEIEHMDGDHSQRKCYALLLEKAPGEAGLGQRIAASAGCEIGSDHELSELTLQLAELEPRDEALLAACVELTRHIGSDYERRRALIAIMLQGDAGPELLEAVARSAEEVGSDHERAEVLIALADTRSFEPQVADAFFDAVAGIGSDHETKRVLVSTLARHGAKPHVAAGTTRCAERIGSDHERAEVLGALVETTPPGDTLAPGFFDAVNGIGSDHEHGRVLLATLAAPPGAKITETGDEGVKQLKDAFKAGYGDVYKGHTFKPDFQMVQDMAAAPGNLTVPLSNEPLKKYWGTVNNALGRFPMGGLPARNVKGTIEADLGQAGRGLQASLVKEEQDLGKAILGARDALRDSMKRSLPPADAAKLAPLDAAYPNYAAVRSASDKAKAQLGAFSPNQLQRSAPQGSALRELADMGQAALPTRLPNTFSADRGLMAGLLGFLGPAASGAATGNPYLLGASLAPLMYSRPFMMYEMGRWTPDLVRQMSPGAAQGLLYRMQQPSPQE